MMIKPSLSVQSLTSVWRKHIALVKLGASVQYIAEVGSLLSNSSPENILSLSFFTLQLQKDEYNIFSP